MKPPVSPDNHLRSTHDGGGTHAPVQPAYRSPTPTYLRECARRYRGTLPPDVEQALLDAAHELEASEDAFAVVVN
ncbi:hypothetical protein [Burkholderia cepacia]|uniref:hypothetical protein n=1 Tax=Burkholderia cepacia TaxID=292 RepID=UPI001C94EEFD|nr:hypothetical protein [Burkholderia cepacia]MBY4803057.1 hypothetical protein [Burkholderia cepacia]MCA8333735.1 hypothetical protein [Burkholderia cepacia]